MSGIWRHAALLDDPATAARALDRGWTLGEGDTPLQERPDLAAALGVGRLLLKREDLNPGGSHKARGLLYQVVHHRGEAPGTCVLSSSGNAATAAGLACDRTGDRLVTFVSPATSPAKLARIRTTRATVVETLKPINFGRYAARVFGLQDLRGTRDPLASVGYRSLAAELAEQAPDMEALFTFSSSGISMVGLADGFDRLGLAPALWSVQSGECLGIARVLHPGLEADPTSPAGRLGIRNPPGAETLARRLAATGGGARAVRGDATWRGQGLLDEAGVHTSPEGGAVLAGITATPGLERATVVAVMTGAPNDEEPAGAGRTEAVEPPVRLGSYLDVRRFFVDVLGLEPA